MSMGIIYVIMMKGWARQNDMEKLNKTETLIKCNNIINYDEIKYKSYSKFHKLCTFE